jgi:hypothetical protein
MNNSTTTQIVEKLTALPDDLQQKVLEYVQTLTVALAHGVPGRQLLRFAGVIPFDDLQRMRDAIETGCEQVDVNEW